MQAANAFHPIALGIETFASGNSLYRHLHDRLTGYRFTQTTQEPADIHQARSFAYAAFCAARGSTSPLTYQLDSGAP